MYERELALAVVIGMAVACGGDRGTPATPTPTTAPDTLGDTTEPVVLPSPVAVGAWSPCPAVPGVDSDGAECATVELPLDHDDPSAGTLEALVKRLPAEGEETGQVWVLHGGPGASATDDLVGLTGGLPQRRPDLGYYAVDHRGIGGTARLSCPDQEAADSVAGAEIADSEWDACMAYLDATWGADLQHLTTTASARDLGSLVEALAGDDAEVFVYGGSYGTWLAQRYLALFPDQPAGAILDGIMPATASFVGYDARMNAAGHALMDVCAADSECAGHFGGEDPWAVAERLVPALDDGHCAVLGMSSDEARIVLGYLTLYDPLRDLVPALVHRLDRCTLDDAAAVLSLIEGVFGGVDPGGNDGEGRSYLLGVHVGLSELWLPAEPPPLDQVVAEFEAQTMALGENRTLALLADRWPSFAPDRWHGEVVPWEGPLLMLQGGLDSATQMPLVAPVGEIYDGPAQTFAVFPFGAHGLLTTTLMPDGTGCAENLTVGFLDDPEAPVDLSCIDEVLPPNFDGDPLYALFLFGSLDVWGD